MGVRFILGRAGSGKSHKMMTEIQTRLQQVSDERLFLLVPEQFTLQAERDLITFLGRPGIIRVEILSFTRLARRVFDQVGGLTRVLLDEQGKHIVLRKTIDEHIADLTIYRKAAAQPGFVPRLGELLSDLKGHYISPDQLRNSVSGQEGMLVAQKVNDVSLIYDKFNDYLQGRYLDTDDYLNLLVGKIGEAQFLANSHFWVDGFNTLSPQSLKILARLMTVVKQMNVSLTIDPHPQARDRDLFSLSWQGLARLQELAQEAGLEQEVVMMEPVPGLGPVNPAIKHLEQELFAYPSRTQAEEIEDVEIFAAANRSSEVEYAAAQVVQLVRERGWRYHDLAVVCNHMDGYGPLIKRVFTEYGIPVFMDRKRSLMDNSIIRLVLSSLEIIRRNYRYEDVFAYLKTGFTGLDPDQVEVLENFALRYGIQGQRWQRSFSSEDPDEEDQLNTCREMLTGPLVALAAKVQGRRTVTSFCQAHYQYLVEIGLPARVQASIERMNELGRLEAARENEQIWNIILDIMDQMVEIMGDQEVGLKEYRQLLEAGFESLEVGIIPTTIDQVLVGDIQRSKSHAIKGLLLLGVNDGIIPSSGGEEGILTEYEKEALQAQGLELGFDKNRRSAEERFLIYTALSKPDHYLGLSYALADEEGKALRPSILINRLQGLLPQVPIISDAVKHRSQEIHQVATPNSTYKYLTQNLRALIDSQPVDQIWGEIYQWYRNQDDWGPHLEESRQALYHRNQVKGIGTKLAERLYSLPLRSSVSRLEQYVNCPFAHFVRYGLRPQERQVYEVAAPDIGELFHNCLRSFALQLEGEKLDWRALERCDSDRIVDQVMDSLVATQSEGIFTSSPRYQHLASRLKRISRRAAWVLTQQLQKGEFIPSQFEVGFGPGQMYPAIEIELGDGRQLYLEGRIDRVDLLETEEGTFVKIIDYKSGRPEFKLGDIYHGLSLQLMIYLMAVVAGQEGQDLAQLRPGCVFYFKIDDPLVDTGPAMIEAVEREIARKFKLRGLMLADVKLVNCLDKDLQAGTSDVVPAGFKKDGNFTSASSVISADDLQALLTHVQGLLILIGQEINLGRVHIHPVKMGNHTACKFCSYRGICQFDQRLEDNRFRVLPKYNNEDVLGRIRGKGR